MSSYTCKLCDPPSRYEGERAEDTLLDHIEVTHNLDKVTYLRAIQANVLVPDAESRSYEEPTEDELAILRDYAAQGFDPNDNRIKRVCFLTSTLKRMEADIRSKATTAISTRDLSDLRPLYKEIRDTIQSIRVEMRLENQTTEDEDVLQECLADAERYIKENPGDFQFRCGNCSAWVQTDGLPVWMLFQERDPNNPERIRVHVGNPETFFLIKKGYLPLSLAAFMLRTSPEGIMWTSDQRGERMFTKDGMIEALEKSEAELRQVRAAFEEYQEESKTPN
jgi:hypothetical protein